MIQHNPCVCFSLLLTLCLSEPLQTEAVPVDLGPAQGVPGAYNIHQGLIARAVNTDPERIPSIGVWLRSRDDAQLAIAFPDVPGLVADGWMYESASAFSEFDGAAVRGENTIELYHRYKEEPSVVHVTTVAAAPGTVEITGSLLIEDTYTGGNGITAGDRVDTCLTDTHQVIGSYWPWLRDRYPDLPDLAPDLCFQLIRSPTFRTAPLDVSRNRAVHAPFLHRYAGRCYIYTEEGRTYLDRIPRTQIASKHPDFDADDIRNNPPVTQVYFGPDSFIPDGPYCNRTRFTVPLIATESLNGKYLVAMVSDSPEFLYQGWLDCLHNYARWLPIDAPPWERQWRIKIYAMENDPDALVSRVRTDFPDQFGPSK